VKPLGRLIIVFCIALALPLGYLVFHSYRSLEKEETATLTYFAETLFDEMDAFLAELLRREEGRPIDAYSPQPGDSVSSAPLAHLPAESYIQGFLQNNPDGSFQSPLEAAVPRTDEVAARLSQLEDANRIFNRRRSGAGNLVRAQPVEAAERDKQKPAETFSEKYLDSSLFGRSRKAAPESRHEEVTRQQARNLAGQMPRTADADLKSQAPAATRGAAEGLKADAVPEAPAPAARSDLAARDESAGIRVEVAPFQSVLIDEARVFVFRRIVINGQIYRQGLVLQVDALLSHLMRTFFASQPMAGFTRLRMSSADQGKVLRALDAGAAVRRDRFVLTRTFAPPFAFLQATLSCDDIPPSVARSTLNWVLAALAGIFLLGISAIYVSTRKLVDFSERQTRFVSSVTHELKTPLTNIRMYIEMLEQGVARDPEREQEYFRILDAEGRRLSRLITNVLELSRLEKRHRRPELHPGDFEDVLAEVGRLAAEGIRQAGFTLTIENHLTRRISYDCEIMVQVLVNLIENSLKFGRACATKQIAVRLHDEGRRIRLEVSDTGPGIPGRDLKKIFNDFYRSEDAAVRAAGGTGIGLALVRRFVALVGGEVAAKNNDGAGCTITVWLPG
jgi:signal transduction histidine kinase